MILFYSNYCQHCNILLETIKKHDKNNIIKLVSIDVLRSLQKPLDPKIHSVPALLLIDKKEYLFGKAVFDYLLLPNRGILFTKQSTRDDKRIVRENELSGGGSINSSNDPMEPMAFTLGAISAEQFSSIDDEQNNNLMTDKNYNWDVITNDRNITDTLNNTVIQPGDIGKTVDMSSISQQSTKGSDDTESGSKKKLPSMEDIMKQRANDIL
jgi:hypothetical protein